MFTLYILHCSILNARTYVELQSFCLTVLGLLRVLVLSARKHFNYFVVCRNSARSATMPCCLWLLLTDILPPGALLLLLLLPPPPPSPPLLLLTNCWSNDYRYLLTVGSSDDVINSNATHADSKCQHQQLCHVTS